ncbi:hypothetical protein HGM15179_000607 [Zosterops borbonicus]|uniref:Uncharacterized protein n=1 Tax=Zosterops borbonicus TaxID=364589 RepID=A0A8K1LTN0_9PASS|nr:hypothetical protein HGM15179_000607 [Zosterops borbonicus]
MVGDLLHHLDTNGSLGMDGIHLGLLRELVEVLTGPLSIIYQQSWPTGQVPGNWRSVNVMPIDKKGWKRPREPQVCQCDIGAGEGHGAAHQDVPSDTHTGHPGVRPSQHRFRKDRSCLTNLISFSDQVTW